MPKKTVVEKDCTQNCKSARHIQQLVSLIYLPAVHVNDDQIASYLVNTSNCFKNNTDGIGRTVLHAAASCGRTKLCEWLVRVCKMDINARDKESGYTPLHRSLYSGKINTAVLLIKLGANATIYDNNGGLAFDLVPRIFQRPFNKAASYRLRKYGDPKINTLNPRILRITERRCARDNQGSDVIVNSTGGRLTFYENANCVNEWPCGHIQSYPESSIVFGQKDDTRIDQNQDTSGSSSNKTQRTRERSTIKSETYTWGINANYTTGFSNEHCKQYPELLEFFEKKDIRIEQVRMQKFHTLFLTEEGNVFACGVGQGGRLGLDPEGTFLIPQRIPTFGSQKCCISIASGRDHSVFLCETGEETEVFTCGTNTYHQLGIKPMPRYAIKPTPITKISVNDAVIIGIAASTYITVFWTHMNVFCCGFNGGQLNIPEKYGEYIDNWTQLPVRSTDKRSGIYSVACCDGATAILTHNCMLYIFNEKKHFVITVSDISVIGDSEPPRVAKIVKIGVYGGRICSPESGDKRLPPTSAANKLTVAILNRNHELVYADEDKHKLIKCCFTQKRTMRIRDFVCNKRGLIIVTTNGFAYMCSFRCYVEFPANINPADRKSGRQNYCREWLMQTKSGSSNPYIIHGTIINLCLYNIFDCSRIPFISKATSIFSDADGDNYAVIQVPISARVLNGEYHGNQYKLHCNMNTLFSKTANFAGNHDVVYKVGDSLYPAHRYIVCLRSELLGTLPVTQDPDIVELFGISPVVFQCIYTYIYTLTYDVFTNVIPDLDGFSKLSYYLNGELVQCDEIKFNNNRNAEQMLLNPLEYVRYLAVLFGMTDLVYKLDQCMCLDIVVVGCPIFSEYDYFIRDRYPSLQDIRIITEDLKHLYAHKCVLICRSEYFDALFSQNWAKLVDGCFETTINIKCNVMDAVLDFIYTDNFSNGLSFNVLCGILMAADQLLLPMLKIKCAIELANHVNARNAASILQFADMYTSPELTECALNFIVSNLVAILEARILEDVGDRLSNEINEKFLRDLAPNFVSRQLPTYNDSYEWLVEQAKIIHATNPVDISFTTDDDMMFVAETEEQSDKKQLKGHTGGRKRRGRRSSKNDDDESCDAVAGSKDLSVYQKELEPLSFSSKTGTEDDLQANDSWVKVEKHVKLVKSRLKIIDMINNESTILNYENGLTKLPVATVNFVEPQQAMDLDVSQPSTSTGITYNIDYSKMTPKMSQKKRSRLNSNSQNLSPSSSPVEQDSSTSPKPAWVVNENRETNLSDIMASEKQHKITTKVNTKRSKMKTFEQMQVEDKAIQELVVHYNALDIRQERISVQRVLPDSVSAPLWITPKKK